MSEDDLSTQFVSITGASPAEAMNWLEMAGFVLQDAVDLYFNSEGGGGLDDTAQPSSHATRKESYDERFAYDEDNVRLPDAVKRQKLLDAEARLENQVSRKITSAFTSGKSSKHQSDKEKTLSKLFQAPTDIMTQTSFEEAREIAKSENKWLLVNIQRDSEFQSHALNRDFWSDECVKDMVQCSFVFWQKLDVTPEGEVYTTNYKVSHFPHIAILDPRTGASKWQHKPTATIVPKLLAEKLQDFLGDNPTPADSRPIQSSRPAATLAGTAAASSSNASSGKTEDGVSGTVESVSTADAQLVEAIRLSLQQQQSVPSSATVSSSSSGSSNSKNVGISAVVDLTEHSKQQAINTPQSGFLVSEALSLPPSANSETTGASPLRAQLRFPDNKKLTEKFCCTQSIAALVLAVAKQVAETHSAVQRFDVQFNFPRQSLSDALFSPDPALNTAASTTGSIVRALETVTATRSFESLGIHTDTVFYVTFL